MCVAYLPTSRKLPANGQHPQVRTQTYHLKKRTQHVRTHYSEKQNCSRRYCDVYILISCEISTITKTVISEAGSSKSSLQISPIGNATKSAQELPKMLAPPPNTSRTNCMCLVFFPVTYKAFEQTQPVRQFPEGIPWRQHWFSTAKQCAVIVTRLRKTIQPLSFFFFSNPLEILRTHTMASIVHNSWPYFTVTLKWRHFIITEPLLHKQRLISRLGFIYLLSFFNAYMYHT